MTDGLSLDRQPPAGKTWADFQKQGVCKVCQIPMFGWSPLERDCCGDEHCQKEWHKKHPCKFKRLRNLEVT